MIARAGKQRFVSATARRKTGPVRGLPGKEPDKRLSGSTHSHRVAFGLAHLPLRTLPPTRPCTLSLQQLTCFQFALHASRPSPGKPSKERPAISQHHSRGYIPLAASHKQKRTENLNQHQSYHQVSHSPHRARHHGHTIGEITTLLALLIATHGQVLNDPKGKADKTAGDDCGERAKNFSKWHGKPWVVAFGSVRLLRGSQNAPAQLALGLVQAVIVVWRGFALPAGTIVSPLSIGVSDGLSSTTPEYPGTPISGTSRPSISTSSDTRFPTSFSAM